MLSLDAGADQLLLRRRPLLQFHGGCTAAHVRFYTKTDGFYTINDGFTLKVMDFTLKPMEFLLKMMDLIQLGFLPHAAPAGLV